MSVPISIIPTAGATDAGRQLVASPQLSELCSTAAKLDSKDQLPQLYMKILKLEYLKQFLAMVEAAFEKQPHALELRLGDKDLRAVNETGGYEGYFFDMVKQLSKTVEFWAKSRSKISVFVGNPVGKGGFGLETLLLQMALMALKIIQPNCVFLMRSKSTTRSASSLACSFTKELKAKYGEQEGEELFELFVKVFCRHPWLGTGDEPQGADDAAGALRRAQARQLQ